MPPSLGWRKGPCALWTTSRTSPPGGSLYVLHSGRAHISAAPARWIPARILVCISIRMASGMERGKRTDFVGSRCMVPMEITYMDSAETGTTWRVWCAVVRERNGVLWICCPCCKLPLHQIRRDTRAEHFPIICRRCRRTVGEVNI